MANPVDVADIPTLSAAKASALRNIGLFTSADLNRTHRSGLLARVASISLAEIRRWQSFSRLLEIETITPDAARLLLAAGIESLDEFSSRTLVQLRAVVGGPPVGAADQTIVTWLMSAQRLRYTGVINGTVHSASVAAIEGATVKVGNEVGLTDARGRFRVVGLSLGTSYTVTIDHPTAGAKMFRKIVPSPSSALVGQRFKMPARLGVLGSLSALHGDSLPALGSAPVTTDVQTSPPDPKDVLRVVNFYADGDARAASRFLDFSAGRFVVRIYRIQKSSLPAGTAIRDDLVMTSGVWTKTHVSAGRLGRWARMAAVQRKTTGRTPTAQLVDKLTKELLAAFSDPK
jgi:hypothetical protein